MENIEFDYDEFMLGTLVNKAIIFETIKVEHQKHQKYDYFGIRFKEFEPEFNKYDFILINLN